MMRKPLLIAALLLGPIVAAAKIICSQPSNVTIDPDTVIADVGMIVYPKPKDHLEASNCFTNAPLNEAGDKQAFVLHAPKSGVINKVFVYTGAVTTPQPLRVTFQTVSPADGNPTGDNFGGASTSTIASPTAWTGYTVSFTTGATVTRGDIFSYVIEFDGVGGDLQTIYASDVNEQVLNIASRFDQANGQWSRQNNGNPIAGLGYSDGTFPQQPGITPLISTHPVTDFTSISTPDEYALTIVAPKKVRLQGVRWYHGNATGNYVFKVYANGSTYSYTVDKDYFSGEGRYAYYVFPDAITMESGQTYRIAMTPASGSVRISYNCYSPVFIGNMSAGGTAYLSTRTDSGTWTDLTNCQPYMNAILDGI